MVHAARGYRWGHLVAEVVQMTLVELNAQIKEMRDNDISIPGSLIQTRDDMAKAGWARLTVKRLIKTHRRKNGRKENLKSWKVEND